MFRFLPFLLAAPLFASIQTAGSIADQLHKAAFDPKECYRVSELNFSKEDLKVYLTYGYLIFSKPIEGVRPSAVFSGQIGAGDGEILLMPPTRGERLSLANFTDSPTLDEHFKNAMMIFTDSTGDELMAAIRASSHAKPSPEMGALLAEQWNAALPNMTESFEMRLVADTLAGNRKTGFFYIALSGGNRGNFDVIYDPLAADQIVAGQLAYRDNRAYFDIWTSFPARSSRTGAPRPGAAFALDDFQIDCVIQPDLTIKAITRLTLKPRRPVGRALPFFIARNMRVTEATVDGQPVEVFQRDSLRSNLMHGGDNVEFMLVLPSDLDPGRPHKIEFHHEGAVILKAGDGVLYVASRSTWYPQQGLGFANYDLTFRYPKNLVLAATGEMQEDRVDGDVRIGRWKSETLIRYAGFNLGDFRSVNLTEGSFKIAVYANRSLERSLQLGTAETVPSSVLPRAVRSPRQPIGDASPAPPPDPAARLDILAHNVADALAFYSAKLGPPPCHNLSVTPIPGTFGQGFPGLVYLSTLAYLDSSERPANMRDRTRQLFYNEMLEAHEVAHQWWGNLVLPAGYQEEWLMESLADYCALMLLEKKQGGKALDGVLEDYKNRLLSKNVVGRTVESSGPITWGYRLRSSLAPDAWRVITYEKGSWIIHMLRRRLGDPQFAALLRKVCEQYRFSTLSTEQFRETAARFLPPDSPDPELKGFFDAWVYGTGIPAVKLSYALHGLKVTGTVAAKDVDDDFTAYVPVEIQTGRTKMVRWLATGSDPVPFSISLKLTPSRVALLTSDALITSHR